MMNNATTEILPTTNIFRRYLLGDSFKSILIRLAIILSAIVTVWSGIMLALIIHTKCQRSKQKLKTSIPHHHLCDSTSSLTRKQSTRSKRNRRYDSSTSSPSTSCCNTICRFLSDFIQYCIFCSSSASSSSVDNEISKNESPTIVNPKLPRESMPMNSHTTSNKVQVVVESMTRRSFYRNSDELKIGKKISLYRESDSSSSDELKTLYTCDNDYKHSIEVDSNTSNTIQTIRPKECTQRSSMTYQNIENKNELQKVELLSKPQKFNTKVTLSWDPSMRRVSNASTNSCSLVKNTIQTQQPQQQQLEPRKSLLMISSTRTLQTKTDYERRRSMLDDPTTTDGSVTSSSKHIPLVMITDTSSSNTNIVELETYEDRTYLVSDVERRLSRELRATYRPRHST